MHHIVMLAGAQLLMTAVRAAEGAWWLAWNTAQLST